MRVPLAEGRVLRVESALEKKVRKRLEQIFRVNAEIIAGIPGIFDPLHGAALKADRRRRLSHPSLIVLAAVSAGRTTLFATRSRLAFLLFGREASFFRAADPPVRIQTIEDEFRRCRTHGVR